jgi:hypothetical protein
MEQANETAGPKWFDLPAPELTDKVKQDLQVLKSRGILDPKRHYKKEDKRAAAFPKFFQFGTIVNNAADFYSGRLTRKEQKAGIVEEVLADKDTKGYLKKKFLQIQEVKGLNGKNKKKKKKSFGTRGGRVRK